MYRTVNNVKCLELKSCQTLAFSSSSMNGSLTVLLSGSEEVDTGSTARSQAFYCKSIILSGILSAN